MKKTQIDLLHQLQVIDIINPLLTIPPKTPQQNFLLTYLGIRLLDINEEIPILPVLLNPPNGSFSQLLLLIKYMRKCVDKGQLLDNTNFHILSTLILWMSQQEKAPRNPKTSLVYSIFLPHPNQLHIQQFQQVIVYLNYIALDVIKILKSGEVDADDLLQLLEIVLPRVYYNIILNLDSLGFESEKTSDVLFYNQSLQFFTRTNNNYRVLCKTVLKHLLSLPLKPNQMKELLERACRYYQLFWKDHKQSTQLFLAAFEKATEAARFALTDEFVLFFKVIGKLGDTQLERLIRNKHEGMDNLLKRFSSNQSIIGHPKGEVNPFNAIGVKQNIKVEAGKASHRIIEIYNQYSLFHFKVDIEAYDISVRLYFLGDFQSKVEVKKLLLTQQKVSIQLRSAFVAAKRGLYMIEFDNSYSWLNAKNLKFEYILLAQFKDNEYPVWMNNLLELNLEKKVIRKKSNDIKENEEVSVVKSEEKIINQPRSPKIDGSLYVQDSDQTLQVESQDKYEQQKPNIQLIEIIPEENIQKIEKEADKNTFIPEQIQELPQESTPIKTKQPQLTAQKVDETIQIQQKLQQSEDHSPASKQNESERQDQVAQKNEQTKNETSQIKSSNSLPSQEGSDKIDWGQGNLSLIDDIFSLLVNIQDHTYEFQTNLEDRIIKRLRAYCQGQEKLHWIFNSQARDWLKRHGFTIAAKNGVTLLKTVEQGKFK